MHSPIHSLVSPIVIVVGFAGCQARQTPPQTTAPELRLAAREAFLASDAALAVLSRLDALGCEAGSWGLYRWPVGITVLDGQLGAAMVEDVSCGEGRHAQLVITAAGAADLDASWRVSVAAVVVTPGSGEEPMLLVPDSDGEVRELALSAEVSAEIERAIGAASESESEAAIAPLLSASDLDEVAGACRRAFRGFGPDDVASVVGGDIPTRGDCATCMSDVAHCLGVMSRLSEAHNACMATLYCANQTDAEGVREALGGRALGVFGAAEIERWFGGAEDCDAVGTGADDIAYCANLYVQGGAAPRTWDEPADSCDSPLFDYGIPPSWGGACNTRSRCFSSAATGGSCTAPVAGVVYWTEMTHRGIDCAGPVGTELVAMGPGRVHVHAANYPGQVVTIDHELTPAEAAALGVTPDDEGRLILHSMYGHVAAVVSDGQLVEPGQLIATIADHPDADEHVHWETQTVTHFDCPGPGGTDSSYGPGYEWNGYPTRTGGDWMNPGSSVTTLTSINEAPHPTAAMADGFETLQAWLARATSSEGLTHGDIVRALEDGTLFVPTEGALAGIFALTDLTAARDAGYFANFASLQHLRSGYLGGGPGTQFYCATEMDTLYSCHPPLCFGAPAGTTSDGVTSDCFEMSFECELGLCGDPELLIATLAPLPSTLDLARPAFGWNASSLAYWPRAAIPTHVECEYVLPTDDRCPTDEATYMPSRYRVTGEEVMTLECPEPSGP